MGAHAQMLIKKGADVTIVHKRGGTALIEAAGASMHVISAEPLFFFGFFELISGLMLHSMGALGHS
jgi:hypothetical protein